jgi:putative transport protein
VQFSFEPAGALGVAMELFQWLAGQSPLIYLFVAVALGYLVGKLKVGNFVLGGIAGTLIVGVVLGQSGVQIDSSIKSIFFALFIYAVGYQGGPQFFRALSLKSLNQLLSAATMCILGLLTVLAFARDLGSIGVQQRDWLPAGSLNRPLSEPQARRFKN